MNFESPFATPKGVEIPEDTQVIFVSDLFIEDYLGGAELTTEALITSSPLKTFKLHAKDLTMEVLQNNYRKYWIFGNWAQLDFSLIPSLAANVNYTVLEYDYKYCRYRSPERHKEAEQKKCDCDNEQHGKMVSAFMYGARSLFWMSEKQQEKYHSMFPFLSERENTVLSSVFDDNFFLHIKQLREKHKDTEKKGWIVLGSPSWIKGADQAKMWCETTGKECEAIWGLPYAEVLDKLAQAEGFAYLPKGGDTCPRMVIEAKLLGCELHLNSDVEHAEEEWFTSPDAIMTESYLFAARELFWRGIKNSMEWKPTISGYTTTKDCVVQKYPWRESIGSMLGFCDEVVVVDGGSKDGTWEELVKWAESDSRLKVFREEKDWTHPRFAVFDGVLKASAKDKCTSEFCLQLDADEIIHEDDYAKYTGLCKRFPAVPGVDVVSLPVIEFWGSADKVRIDINPQKWRLFRNKKHITHGIHKQLRKFDKDGNLCASPGTDGCFMINRDTGDLLPHSSYFSDEMQKMRVSSVENEEIREKYQEMWNNIVVALPSVYHFSWFNIERKIHTYKDYWQKHWESLYDVKQDDTAENNNFFNKPWSEVTDEEIGELAKELSAKLGGHIFHTKVDWSKPTPWITLKRKLPKIMDDWVEKNTVT